MFNYYCGRERRFSPLTISIYTADSNFNTADSNFNTVDSNFNTVDSNFNNANRNINTTPSIAIFDTVDSNISMSIPSIG